MPRKLESNNFRIIKSTDQVEITRDEYFEKF